MQEADDEDEYSDNDLDALPSDTLYELQQDAIRSTQKVDRHERPKLPVMTRQPRPPPAHLNASLANLGNAFHNTNAQSNSHQPSSDYGDFDDEMLDGEIFDAADEPLIAAGHKNNVAGRPVGEGTQREQWRQQRYGALPEPQLYGRDQKLDLGGKLPVSRKLAAVPKKSSNNRDPQTLREREEIDKLAGLCIQDSTAMGKLEAQVQQVCSYPCTTSNISAHPMQ